MSSDKTEHPLLRLIDPRIPLPWVLTGVLVAAGMLIGMYYQLQKVTEALQNLQIEVKAGNQSWATLSGEQALQKFRLGNIDAELQTHRGELAGLRSAVSALQARR